MDQKIAVCRTVLYTLSQDDVDKIRMRRGWGGATTGTMNPSSPYHGNDVEVGQSYPLIVTKVDGIHVSGQVLLNGNDCMWANRVTEASELGVPGGWSWPPRS